MPSYRSQGHPETAMAPLSLLPMVTWASATSFPESFGDARILSFKILSLDSVPQNHSGSGLWLRQPLKPPAVTRG